LWCRRPGARDLSIWRLRAMRRHDGA
jgi:hypothetical protein